MTIPLSNPMGQLTAAQQAKLLAELNAARQRVLRMRISLLTIVVGISMMAVAGGLAFGWVGALTGLGIPTFVLGLMLGMFTPGS
jgi:hypothetical protein